MKAPVLCLSNHQEAAHERERRRISQELHDQVGQRVSALKLGLDMLAQESRVPLPVRQRLTELEQVAVELAADVHRLSWELRPGVLDEFGIEPALRTYTMEWSERTGVPVQFDYFGSAARCLPPSAETVIYRVTLQALANIEQHARARQVSVVLTCGKGFGTLLVEDDGKGFDANAVLAHGSMNETSGLQGMQARVRLAGGTIQFESASGKGTSVLVRLPLAGPPAAH